MMIQSTPVISIYSAAPPYQIANESRYKHIFVTISIRPPVPRVCLLQELTGELSVRRSELLSAMYVRELARGGSGAGCSTVKTTVERVKQRWSKIILYCELEEHT